MRKHLRAIPMLPAAYRAARHVFLTLHFRRDYRRFQQLLSDAEKVGAPKRFDMRWADRWPCLYERHATIRFEPHYTYHPAWAARVLAQTRPHRHVDIGSALPFVTILSAFVPIDYYEWRPPQLKLSGLVCHHANLLSLPFGSDSLPSLSCMHTIEHVGLGRYGDPVDVNGDLKAINELKRVLAPNGDLLFVVPIGRKAEILFNAQRTYSYNVVMDAFSDLILHEFALILEDGSGIVDHDEAKQRVQDQKQGCGCFWFRKAVSTSSAAIVGNA